MCELIFISLFLLFLHVCIALEVHGRSVKDVVDFHSTLLPTESWCYAVRMC